MSPLKANSIWKKWKLSDDKVQVVLKETGERFYWVFGVIFQQVKPHISVRTSERQISVIREKIEQDLFSIVRVTDDEHETVVFKP